MSNLSKFNTEPLSSDEYPAGRDVTDDYKKGQSRFSRSTSKSNQSPYVVQDIEAYISSGEGFHRDIVLSENTRLLTIGGGGDRELSITSANPIAKVIITGGGNVDVIIQGITEDNLTIEGGGSKKYIFVESDNAAIVEKKRRHLQRKLDLLKQGVQDVTDQISNLDEVSLGK